ncbi:methyl-accepting chemotaxis protein [Brevibacillus humidisoli]|uniref:methyl-accepting chemotaxis protein n=1 Tax=Brevibacillus humidisoli TaxID=2895522 RepID=UPI001E42A8DD|nr:methyl-accepting chemotaxis protein [Brevibacillus humidisoli]UFJ40929.1 methyl-accepting chemotaxis protein [Brevibacillus humidisoli]
MKTRYFSIFHRLHQRVPLSAKITIPFLLIIILSLGAMGWLFYTQTKNNVVTLVETRLLSETKKVTEKISLLAFVFAADEQQFSKRLTYELRQLQADLAQQDLSVNQLVVSEGSFQPIDKITRGEVPFGSELAASIEAERAGVTHVDIDGTIYTLAYSPSPEEHFIYVITVEQEQYLAPLHKTANLILYAVIISLLMSLLFGWLVVRSVTKPFRVLIEHMKNVSAGNLTERTNLQKEGPELHWIAVSFNTMIEQMSQMIREINQMIKELHQSGEQMQQSADEARQRSAQLFSHVETVNRGVVRTASATQEATLSFSQMTEAINQLLVNINAVIQSSAEMNQVSDYGQQQLDEVTSMMREFTLIFQRLEEKMDRLNGHSQSIGQVVHMIQGLAKQTKLLALNASIEAARAGQSGKGFAVVAQEIGLLADESQKAALDISELIQRIQSDVALVADETKDAAGHLPESQRRVESTEQSFATLRHTVAQTNEQMDVISQGLSHLSATLAEVDQTLQSFVAISQETLDCTSEMTSASKVQLDAIDKSKHLADQLIQLSSRLDEMSQQFTVA